MLSNDRSCFHSDWNIAAWRKELMQQKKTNQPWNAMLPILTLSHLFVLAIVSTVGGTMCPGGSTLFVDHSPAPPHPESQSPVPVHPQFLFHQYSTLALEFFPVTGVWEPRQHRWSCSSFLTFRRKFPSASTATERTFLLFCIKRTHTTKQWRGRRTEEKKKKKKKKKKKLIQSVKNTIFSWWGGGRGCSAKWPSLYPLKTHHNTQWHTH